MVPVVAETILLMKSTAAVSLPPGAPGMGTMAWSLPAVIWFWIWVSWLCGRKKESLIGCTWVIVTNGVELAAVITLPG